MQPSATVKVRVKAVTMEKVTPSKASNFHMALGHDVYFGFIFGFQIFEGIFSADLDV